MAKTFQLNITKLDVGSSCDGTTADCVRIHDGADYPTSESEDFSSDDLEPYKDLFFGKVLFIWDGLQWLVVG